MHESDKLCLKSGHNADLTHKFFTDSYQNIWQMDTEVMLKRNREEPRFDGRPRV